MFISDLIERFKKLLFIANFLMGGRGRGNADAWNLYGNDQEGKGYG
jgi:hypothetical protein